eukprot:1394652-Amorphochlora_amoeboformis.AAC.2
MDEGFVEVELIEPREAHIYFELPIGLRFEFVWLAQSSKFLQYYGYYNFMKVENGCRCESLWEFWQRSHVMIVIKPLHTMLYIQSNFR